MKPKLKDLFEMNVTENGINFKCTDPGTTEQNFTDDEVCEYLGKEAWENYFKSA